MKKFPPPPSLPEYNAISHSVCTFLDEQKAENIISIDLSTKCSFTDGMVVASGRSQRHLKAMADNLKQHLHEKGLTQVRVEGTLSCDWVLVDAGLIIIHLFRPEVREIYNLEKMWSKESSHP